MGLLSRFQKKSISNQGSDLFSLLFNQRAPSWTENAYSKAYTGWVYDCVTIIAESVGQLELKLQKRSGEGWDDVKDHPVLDLLSKVNESMTFSDLIINTASWLELNGNAFWYLAGNIKGTYPVEIWPLEPHMVKIMSLDGKNVSSIVYTREDGKEVPLKQGEFLHFKRFNPQDRLRGMGTVAAAALSIDIDTYANEWNRNFFYNSAMPSASLELEGKLTPEQFERITKKWEANYKGVQNAHKLVILEGGAKFNKTSLTQQEMDFIETKKLNRDDIFAMFKVSKALAGQAEDFNRANIEGIEYIFSKYVVSPRMKFITDRLSEFLLPMFGLNKNKAEYRMVFTNPVPRDIQRDTEIRSKALAGLPWTTINEERAKDGLDPIDGGDTLYIPFSLAPIGEMIDPQAPQPTKGAENKPDIYKQFSKVLSGLPQEKSKKKRKDKYIRQAINNESENYRVMILDVRDFILTNIKNGQKTIKGKADDIISDAFSGYDAKWDALFEEKNKQVLSNALERAGQQLFLDVGINGVFDLTNPRAVDWLRDNALRHATSITGTLKDDAKKIIVDAVDNGRSVDEIVSELRSFFNEGADWRALRIARTEVISGYGQGTLEGMYQTGFIKYKRWFTGGANPCETCIANADQGPIPVTQAFQSGHDTVGAHPNCECTLLPVSQSEL